MTNPNDPAYPMPTDAYHNHGLTKRERFAAMAMQGMLASPDGLGLSAIDAKRLLCIDNYDAVNHYPALCALMSARFADALIEALNTPKETTS